jgi:AhpD family alkylhydroperoxidase
VSDPPRIPPGERRDIGVVNVLLARGLGLIAGTNPPRLFTTLARHRRLFRRWLWFAGALMPGGRLPRVDTELAILRVAHLCACAYEWEHHERLGARAGLDPAAVERVRRGPDADGWTRRQQLLLRAVDELHERREIGQETWDGLAAELADTELIELCMLVGHYEMLAMTLNSLRVEPDRPRRRRS